MIKIVIIVVTGITSYCFGVYSAIEANHTHTMNALIGLIAIIKRMVQ